MLPIDYISIKIEFLLAFLVKKIGNTLKYCSIGFKSSPEWFGAFPFLILSKL